MEVVSKEIYGKNDKTCSKIIPTVNCLYNKISAMHPTTNTGKHSKTHFKLNK